MTLDTTQLLILVLLVSSIRDGLLAWAIIQLLRGKDGTAPPVIHPPVVPPVVKPDPPVPPVVHVGPRFNDIITTEWGGAGDEQASAYGGQVHGDQLGYALPYHFPGTPPVIRVFANGKTVDVPGQDVGPWYPSAKGPADKYWETGARPRAESDPRTNGAGLDLTPATWAALGLSGVGKAKMSWDFVSVLGQAQPAPETPPVVVGNTVLQHNVWPLQAECPVFYGSYEAAIRDQLVSVHVPWLMNGKTQTIEIHKKCAESLTRVLNFIWETCGKSQEQIHAFGYDVFDGSFVWRPMRSGHSLSMHAYGVAIDFDAAQNPYEAPAAKTVFKEDSLITTAFETEGWIWGGRWVTPRDAMHFQAARVR